MLETEVKLAKGDWVIHPRMPGWGYGKVLELIGSNKGRVFFLLAGEKKLSWEHAGLNLVEGDKISLTTLNEQLLELKLDLAKDLLTSEELSREVSCTPCDSFSLRCELCKGKSGSLRMYSLAQKGKMCICEVCSDKIMLKTYDMAGVRQNIVAMEKRANKDTTESGYIKKKPKSVRKRK